VRVGFNRKEMRTESLVGTVKHHDCHAFFVHDDASRWPAKEFEGQIGDVSRSMHAALEAAAGAHKGGVHQFAPGSNAVGGKVKLNLAEAGARAHASDAPGDVLIFPQSTRRKAYDDPSDASPERVAAFVRDVFVTGDAGAGLPGGECECERLRGAHVFVCTHAARDARCGLCGPALVDAIRAEVDARGLTDRVAVRGCSHVGGHAYAGNVLVFHPPGGVDADADAAASEGTWYGYVTPREIPDIVERTIRRGEKIPRLWRGSMGMKTEDHAAAAAAAAAAAGETWPPPKSPCEKCDEGEKTGGGDAGGDIEDVAGGDAGGDIEDVAGGGGGGTATAARRADESWVDAVAKIGVVVGFAGVVVSAIWAYLEGRF
jgi:hypothetical protein